MTLNISRIKTFLVCKRKAFNVYHRGLATEKRYPLIDGGAFHAGVAHGLATKNWAEAEQVALDSANKELDQMVFLPGEENEREAHINLVKAMLKVYEQSFEGENYTVIQPECEFRVPMPGTEDWHVTDLWMERVAPGVYTPRLGMPSAEAIIHRRVRHVLPEDAHLFEEHLGVGPEEFNSLHRPHYFVGKTDAIVSWKQNIWLLEHKTTSIKGEQFFSQWRLDLQPTGYIYGIWKALGIRPSGFIINAIGKPSESQVQSWNARRKTGPPKTAADYISYDREAFLRTEQDLARFERQFINTCNEWEERIVSGVWDAALHGPICSQYNRLCDFHHACLAHDEAGSLSTFSQREPDYVDLQSIQPAKENTQQ